MADERILIPTDLTEYGAAALQYAAMLRAPLDAHLTVVYADEPGYPMNMPDMPLAVHERPSEEQAQVVEIVRRHIEPLIPPPEPEIRCSFGFASDVIRKTADDIDASLIIMGTHGRRGLSRMMLGSVTESVLSASTRPLITLAPPAISDHPSGVKTILCPVNFSFVALDSIRKAATMAAKFDADLVVLYVVEEKQPALDQDLEKELASWIEPELRGRSRYRQMVSSGNAAERVLEIADEINADLLVMGAQHRMFRNATVIGTTSERVVRFAKCAVLTVPRPAD